jgi:hypothetical protein
MHRDLTILRARAPAKLESGEDTQTVSAMTWYMNWYNAYTIRPL